MAVTVAEAAVFVPMTVVKYDWPACTPVKPEATVPRRLVPVSVKVAEADDGTPRPDPGEVIWARIDPEPTAVRVPPGPTRITAEPWRLAGIHPWAEASAVRT